MPPEETLRLLAILGSLRANSSNTTLLRVASMLRWQGHTVPPADKL
ncbi:MAG: hypothetical protein HYZ50_10955 [Deltaproteobacteria bacterium]|nr:hypothetical protein [Deltaproteobacteria bacterium]